MSGKKTTEAESLTIGCACAAVRHTARLLTQVYDAELHGDLAAPQFGLLSVLDKRPGCNQAVLARTLDFDKTTLSRNLKLMERNGWIERVRSNDERERGYHLTAKGTELLEAARPSWQRAQRRLQSAMTREEWQAMWRTFGAIKNAAHQIREMQGGAS